MSSFNGTRATAVERAPLRHYPMTKEQRETLDRDLATILESLAGIETLLRACYRDEDPRVYRAGEASAAVQRLLWAMERQAQATTNASAT
jgi:hypothetical protein